MTQWVGAGSHGANPEDCKTISTSPYRISLETEGKSGRVRQALIVDKRTFERPTDGS